MDMKCMVYLQGNGIETTVTCKESVACEWIRDVKSTAHIYQNIVGVDRIQNHGKTVIIQMCVGTKCLLYQALYSDKTNFNPNTWFYFPRDGSFIFAGVDVGREFSSNSLISYNYVDIEALAVVRWCWPMQIISGYSNHVMSPLGIDRGWKPGLKVLARSIAHLNIERPDRVMSSTDWSAKELSMEQIEFACADVFACFRVAFELLKHGNEMPRMMKSPPPVDDDDE